MRDILVLLTNAHINFSALSITVVQSKTLSCEMNLNFSTCKLPNYFRSVFEALSQDYFVLNMRYMYDNSKFRILGMEIAKPSLQVAN